MINVKAATNILRIIRGKKIPSVSSANFDAQNGQNLAVSAIVAAERPIMSTRDRINIVIMSLGI